MNIFTVYSLFYIVLLVIIFFIKKRINTVENTLFKMIMISNLVGVILAILSYFTILNIDKFGLINVVVSKGYIIYLLTWLTLFAIYIFIISIKGINKNEINLKQKKIVLFFGIMYVVFLIMIIINPLYYHNDNGAVYSYGPSANVMYIVSGIYIFIWTLRLMFNIKEIRNKKYLPIFAFMILGLVVMIIQKMHPELLLMTSMETFVVYLMYFTIENPDMKLLKEMHDAKEISDNANEEKTLFLYNMTQEIRATTKNIDNEADIIIDSDSIDIDKDSARNIKGETAKFRTMTNDILDVSAIDASSIKIYNSVYNIKVLLKSLVGNYTEISKNKAIEFRTNIEHNIPEYLYGDSISLKRSINLLLTYSVKNTNKGYVELNLNTIIKNDIVRLIITIEDSSMGIKSDELEKIKVDNKNINEAYKLITLMNGTMVLTSNYGIGNKIKIILDQKIDKNETKEEKQYKEIYNNKKILVIDDNESSIKIIEKLLKGSNIVIDSSLNGKDAINKIRTKNRYDLILLDEELTSISGSELLGKLKSIRNFNIPVILLSKDNKYEYNEEYLKVGFTDILIKPLKKDNLLNIIDKYIDKDEI